MKFLFIFLFLVPLVFTLGSLADYAGENREQNPKECFFKAMESVERSRFHPKPHTDEQIENARVIVKDCIDRIAKINDKVDVVKDELSDKIFDSYKIYQTQLLPCGLKFKMRESWDDEKDEKCWISTGLKPGDYFCNDSWGADGCMIDLWRKECGEEAVQGSRKVHPFLSKRQQECVDLYSHKF
ncbi:unnamed protein product [Caenorhabditis angaria]|uniref:DUF19 domain-containing protein n=1 Tax=Caenorhabditis angaria TaxID=860376 RepID=A0A9P1N164_9PELO|nr:unnamed protein product [Caenorhabditis angaria]